MGLFNFKKKKDFKKENGQKFLSGAGSTDFKHLTKDGELPWGWHTHTKEITTKFNNEYSYFLNMYIESRTKSPLDRYSALKSLVLYLEDVENYCKSADECFEFWFYEVFAPKYFIEQKKAELKELTNNFNALDAEYKKRNKNLANIDAKIISELKANPNIVQADFVKKFDASVQNDVREKLYYLAKNGKLERTKSGKSYTLRYKG